MSMDALNAFISQGLTQTLPGDTRPRRVPEHQFLLPEDTVWHYTNAAGVLGIFQANAFWATSAVTLNDSSEIQFGQNVIKEAYETWPERGKSGPAYEALDAAIADLDRVLAARPTFVLSTSRSERLLNQWMYYADTAGYAVGMKAIPLTVNGYTSEIASRRPMLTPMWLQVLYGNSVGYVYRIFNGLVTDGWAIPAAIERDHELGVRLIEDNLAVMAASMKDDAFASEQEVRFIVTAPPELVRYRAMGRGIVPYVELISAASPGGGYSTVQEQKSDLPLDAVVVGPPEASAQRRIDTLRMFAEHMERSFDIRSARIPFLP